jgi:tRNA threonylcarbamoyladenosine biosynthesis protein TsaE
VFAKGVAGALGIQDPVTSPTFTIVNEYEGEVPLLHIDLYRIESDEEYELLGVDEQFPNSVVLIEWPERAEGALPQATHSVDIRVTGTSSREIRITDWKDDAS